MTPCQKSPDKDTCPYNLKKICHCHLYPDQPVRIEKEPIDLRDWLKELGLV